MTLREFKKAYSTGNRDDLNRLWTGYADSNAERDYHMKEVYEAVSFIQNPFMLDEYEVSFENYSLGEKYPTFDRVQFTPVDKSLKKELGFGIEVGNEVSPHKYGLYTERSGLEIEENFSHAAKLGEHLHALGQEFHKTGEEKPWISEAIERKQETIKRREEARAKFYQNAKEKMGIGLTRDEKRARWEAKEDRKEQRLDKVLESIAKVKHTTQNASEKVEKAITGAAKKAEKGAVTAVGLGVIAARQTTKSVKQAYEKGKESAKYAYEEGKDFAKNVSEKFHEMMDTGKEWFHSKVESLGESYFQAVDKIHDLSERLKSQIATGKEKTIEVTGRKIKEAGDRFKEKIHLYADEFVKQTQMHTLASMREEYKDLVFHTDLSQYKKEDLKKGDIVSSGRAVQVPFLSEKDLKGLSVKEASGGKETDKISLDEALKQIDLFAGVPLAEM